MAYNKNKVIDLYYTDKLYTSDYSLIPDFQIGKPYDTLYGLRQTGINAVTGLPIFIGKDGREIVPGQTQLTRDDFITLGHLTPPYSGSFNLGVTWKNLELDADFYWVAGGIKQYNYTYVRNRDDVNYNALRGLTQTMWLREGDVNKIYYSPSIHRLRSRLSSMPTPPTPAAATICACRCSRSDTECHRKCSAPHAS